MRINRGSYGIGRVRGWLVFKRECARWQRTNEGITEPPDPSSLQWRLATSIEPTRAAAKAKHRSSPRIGSDPPRPPKRCRTASAPVSLRETPMVKIRDRPGQHLRCRAIAREWP
ncbi:hypothetical protein [Lysobacter gummosus]|uniref:hypothetical protein n=1 Tax=Lysobacter gummosus TaxID=262324 RepID=UPI003625F764